MRGRPSPEPPRAPSCSVDLPPRPEGQPSDDPCLTRRHRHQDFASELRRRRSDPQEGPTRETSPEDRLRVGPFHPAQEHPTARCRAACHRLRVLGRPGRSPCRSWRTRASSNRPGRRQTASQSARLGPATLRSSDARTATMAACQSRSSSAAAAPVGNRSAARMARTRLDLPSSFGPNKHIHAWCQVNGGGRDPCQGP